MRYFRTENCSETYELVRNWRWYSAMPVPPLRICWLRCSIAKVGIDKSAHYSTSSVAGIIGGVSYFAAFLMLCSSTASTPSSLIENDTYSVCDGCANVREAHKSDILPEICNAQECALYSRRPLVLLLRSWWGCWNRDDSTVKISKWHHWSQ